jgi:hypothetical protein
MLVTTVNHMQPRQLPTPRSCPCVRPTPCLDTCASLQPPTCSDYWCRCCCCWLGCDVHLTCRVPEIQHLIQHLRTFTYPYACIIAACMNSYLGLQHPIGYWCISLKPLRHHAIHSTTAFGPTQRLGRVNLAMLGALSKCCLAWLAPSTGHMPNNTS